MPLSDAFDLARQEHRAALIVYITAGDPDLETTARLACAIADSGADIIELGVPYSDPIADGPTSQEAGQRALAAGTTVAGVLDCARSIRRQSDVALVIMTCYNPVLRMGPEAFATEAADAGIDGILISDLPAEEAGDWVQIAESNGLDTVFLVASTTEPERQKLVGELSTGFVYVISRPGTTGARSDLPEELPDLVGELRETTDRPLAVGFGISQPEHVTKIAQIADGAVVGSAVVDVIAEHGKSDDLLPAVQELISRLAAATSTA